MRKMTLAEQKEIMLEILQYIDDVATRHHLRYSLWGGTMLGAVRHQGFIPWDDDIDISLPREDYNKLLALLKQKEEYLLVDYTHPGDYTQGWAKLTHRHSVDRKKKYFSPDSVGGVFVDIMPIDGLPGDEEEIKKFKGRVQVLYKQIRASHFPSYASSISLGEAMKRLSLAFPLHVLSKVNGGKETLVTRLETLSQTYPLDKAEKCGHLLSRYRKNLGYPSSIWEETRDYEFEGRAFKGITDSHTYLSLLYGENYMEIPPKSKQITHMEHEFFWKDSVTE